MLSTRELLILAQLGRLRADDLVWRSGSSAKRSIRSMLGSEKPSAARPTLAGLQPTAAASAPEDIEASLIASASGAEEHGRHRKWALAGAITGVAIVVSLAAVGAAVFLQSQPAEPQKPITTRLEAQSAEPVAANDPTPTPPPVTTDEVAVRKVKVLDIPPPPPGP